MRHLVAIALLFAALSASATAAITADPRIPRAGEPFVLSIPDVCRGGRAVVSRSGFDIRIEVTGCGMGNPPMFETLPVSMAPLPPGEYRVTVPQEEEGQPPVARGAFVVVDARPFGIHPFAVPAGAPYELVIPYHTEFVQACAPFESCTIRIGGADVTARRIAGTTFRVTAPARPAGFADVTVGNRTIPGALYFFDRDAAPDPAFFERILLPILVDTRGRDSDWRSEGVVSNPKPWPVETHGGLRFDAHAKRRLAGGQHPRGLAWVVPRAEAEHLSFALRVRDVSRVAQGFGTDIPIVREEDLFRSTLTLLDVPRDPRYRVKLRVYAFDAEDGAEARVVGGGGRVSLTLRRDCADAASCAATPAYAELDVASGAAGERVDLFIELPPGAAGWAFASVTNNQTQQVTIVTPDGTGGVPCTVCSPP